MSKPQHQTGAAPAWYTVILSLAAAVLLVVDQLVVPLLPYFLWAEVALAGAVMTFLITIMQLQVGGRAGGSGWLRVFVYRELVWAGLAGLARQTDVNGWSVSLILWWAGGTIAFAALGTVCHMPPHVERDPHAGLLDRRPEYARTWESLIRGVTGWKTTRVVRWERWENKIEGFRLWVELPADSGETDEDLIKFCTKLGGAARLPQGCQVQVLPSGTQGIAILDVMLVDNLSKSDGWVHAEPTTPASINDSFTVMTSPRGKALDICLRIETATIGGATGSGKTTLLNRIIMFLARCTDCVIWVVDYNGGGLASNWIEPWARGRCGRPVVDWVATDENEFALMTATATAISTARKSNPEIRRRTHSGGTGGVLPVDASLPAIIVLADEGGSIVQKLSAIGAIAADGLSQIAELGRAMAVRSMVSVLRGTSDLMDKRFRTQSSIRLCLRMNEWGEYGHVLEQSPPKAPLKHKGSGYLAMMGDAPVYGRTVNVDEHAIERHAIACSDLRPDLDEHAQQVAARLRPADVTGGDKEYPGWKGSPQYLDAQAGRAYSGRWERAAALLAELRGEEYEPVTAVSVDARVAAATAPASATPALDAFVARFAPAPEAAASQPAATVEHMDGARIYQFPRSVPAPAEPAGGNARRQIIELIRTAGSAGIAAAEIERQADVSRARVYDLLKQLLAAREVGKNAEGLYVLVQYAVATS